MSLVEIENDNAVATPKSWFEAGRPVRRYDGVTDEAAYEIGQCFRAYVTESPEAQLWCKAQGVYRNENLDWLLSPTTSTSLIQQREAYGVFERNARKLPLANTVTRLPREHESVVGYWVGDEVEITTDEAVMGAIELNLRKLGVLIKVSDELDEDSVADFGMIVANMVSKEFARMIDEAGFNGDGTSSNGGITGLANALHANATKTASTSTISDLTQADWEGCANLLEDWDDQPKWFMHRKVFVDSILQDHASQVHIDGGKIWFMAAPVEFVNVMPTSGTSTFVAYFGHLDKAATFGSHGGIRIARSNERFMDSDTSAIRATQKLGLVVHERGDADRRRPIVGLKTAA